MLDSIDASVLSFGPDTGHLFWGGSDPAQLIARLRRPGRRDAPQGRPPGRRGEGPRAAGRLPGRDQRASTCGPSRAEATSTSGPSSPPCPRRTTAGSSSRWTCRTCRARRSRRAASVRWITEQPEQAGPGMSETLGVGILGAGPVTQAIHLPTLARQGDRFRVVSVMDVDPAVAEAVAARAGCRVRDVAWRPVLDNPERRRRRGVQPAPVPRRAGRRDLRRRQARDPVREAAGDQPGGGEADRRGRGSAGVPLVVGAMHVYDPGWLAGARRVRRPGRRPPTPSDRRSCCRSTTGSRTGPPRSPAGRRHPLRRGHPTWRRRSATDPRARAGPGRARPAAGADVRADPGQRRPRRVLQAVRGCHLAHGGRAPGRPARVHAAAVATGLAPRGLGRRLVAARAVHPVVRARRVGHGRRPRTLAASNGSGRGRTTATRASGSSCTTW